MILTEKRTPLTPETHLWRYMSLDALLAMLMSGQLRLTRLDRFDDPFEGSVPFAELERTAREYQDAQEFTRGPHRPSPMQPNDVWRRARNWSEEVRLRRLAKIASAHASCWRHGFESEGMWRLYCKDHEVLGQGVAIRTNMTRLNAALAMLNHKDLQLSAITYRTYHEGDAFERELDCFFNKRRGFSHEQEVRVLVFDSNLAYEFTRYISGFRATEPTQLAAYIYLPMHFPDVVEEIVVSPYASPSYEEAVVDAVAAHAPQLSEKIQLSELSDRKHAIWL